MKEKRMEVGVKYKGYGMLNDFGEFEFTPEATGSRVGQIKVVKETGSYKLSTSKKFVLIHLKLERASSFDLIKELMKVFNNLIQDFKKYEF